MARKRKSSEHSSSTLIGVSAALMATAATVIAKSGIVQSLAAKFRRNSDDRLIDAPPEGTPLVVSLGKVVEHSGIFLGESRVAELDGRGRIQIVSLSQFLNGREDDPSNVRSGTRIFAACDAESGQPLGSSGVAAMAKALTENVANTEYSIFTNNCHLFTASCVKGEMGGSLTFADWLKDGTFSVDRLTKVISDEMNQGRPVDWIGVKGPSGSFNYALTAEKVRRLESEGLA